MANKYKAVIFDLGGVVYDSPLVGLGRYAKELGLPSGFFKTVLAIQNGSWEKFERGEIGPNEFTAQFSQECKNNGAEVSGEKFLSLIATVKPRKEWISAIKKLRAHGFATATITNNFHTSSDAETNQHDQETRRQFFMTLFDVVVESSVEGIRKPDPKIYQLAVQQLGVKYWECIYFDDLGQNLKPAQEMGIHTIKVDVLNHMEALQQLDQLLPHVDVLNKKANL